jgi:type I restriction enzyme S subunit
MSDEIDKLKKKCPSNWDVLPFSDAIKDVTAGNPKVRQGEYQKSGLLAVIDQGQDSIGGYIDDEDQACKERLPCILFGDHTKTFKFVKQPFALGADGVKILSPIGEFDKRFLYHYLNTIKLPDDVGYSRHFKFLKEKYVVKPPLAEQKRIAAILDKADTIRRKRQAAIKLADDFLSATFLDMFGDPVTNPKGWDVVPLKKLGYVTTGNTPPRINPGFYGNDIEWIKSDNINTPYHYLSKATECLSKSGKKVARTAPPLSTLVTCIAGSFNCIGNAALTDRDVCFNQQINAITPYVNTDPFFLYVQILAAKKIIQNASTNSMKGMVSKGIFEQIMLFQPPKDLQRKFGFFFEKYLKTTNTIRSFESINSALFNSLIQRAFRGEL